MRRNLTIATVFVVTGVAVLAARAAFWDDIKKAVSCPEIRASCRDGAQRRIDSKSTGTILDLKCLPCLKKCAYTLKGAINFCEKHGGINRKTLKGFSLSKAVDSILEKGDKAAEIYSKAQGGPEAAVIEEIGKTTREAVKAVD